MTEQPTAPLDTEPTAVRGHRARAREWLGRYAPAEVGAIVGAVLAAGVAGRFGDAVTAALAGAIGETVAFYTVLFVRDLRHWSNGRGGALWRTLRGLLMEFGPAEVLDTLVVRPLAMYTAIALIDNLTVGVIVGKLAADAVFYAMAIIGYERRKSTDERLAAHR